MLGTGDPFSEFYKFYAENKDFHKRNPNEPIENLEKAYKKRVPGQGDANESDIDQLFTGEESYGRTLDLVAHHEQYLNLPGVRGGRRLTYIQYLDNVDRFPLKRDDKLRDEYWLYVRDLSEYLQEFMKKTRPLEDLDSLYSKWDQEFAQKWEAIKVSGWEPEANAEDEKPSTPAANGDDGSMYCADCDKAFNNENVYKSHFTSKKHRRNVEARKSGASTNGVNGAATANIRRLKERAVAEREYRVQRLFSAMQTERSDTKTNVERRMGMTDKERQQEREAMLAELAEAPGQGQDEGSDKEDDDKIYNPLKLPLAWDGKPM